MRRPARNLTRSIAILSALLFIFTLPAVSLASDAELQSETAQNISRDDLSGEDREIRRAALDALGTAAGTVVVMDAQTGRIISMVNQDWAIRHAFKPCSTIKIVTGIAGYGEEIIRPDGSLATANYRLGLDDALAYSNNGYFQKVGAELGNEKMIFYAGLLGLGTVTGINAPGEVPGSLPFGNSNLRIYSHADDFAVTPLQLAVMVSAVTNGGKMVVPQITHSRRERTNFRGHLRRRLDIESRIYRRVIPGMIGAARYGTAKAIRDDLDVAGKTGSCISGGTWVGLFASAAPAHDPKYSVVVITRGRHARGKYSAAIAGKIYSALEPRFGRRADSRLIASNDSRRSSRGSAGGRKVVVKTASTRKIGTKSRKSQSSREIGKSVEELFPTIVIEKGRSGMSRPRVVVDQQ